YRPGRSQCSSSRRSITTSPVTEVSRDEQVRGQSPSARAHGAHGPVIGESHHPLGGDRLAAGAGRFVADVRVSGMLQAAVLRSRHAHARLVSIDAKRALELAGVRAVLTAADVPAHAIIPNRVGAPPGTERYLQPGLARRVGRDVGGAAGLLRGGG